jgi:cell wall-associated NlpC family hydrolase
LVQQLRRRVDSEPVGFDRLARMRVHALSPLALAVVLTSVFGVFGARHALAATPAASWDAAQQRQVVAAGLMAESGGSFAGASHLSAEQANATMTALAARLHSVPSEQAGPGAPQTDEQGSPGAPEASIEPEGIEPEGALEQGGGGEPDERSESGEPGAAASAAVSPSAHTAQSPVTVVTFDRLLVEELGLASVAAHVQTTVAAVGLHPPAYFGSETVARMLELRYEHPVGAQRLDLFPGEPITRAEAAWSLAKALNLSAWSIDSTREALSAFVLPQMSTAQRQALAIAVARIGYPYVWGGTTDNTADGLEHGGFDCSGFAWRVYKVSGLPWGRAIHGRTAAEQAGEIPRSQRLAVGQLEPGDLLFFGSAHFNSKATERNVIHEGIYLGDNWVIHSSGQGVYVLPLSGSWLGSSFAWGRHVIR